MAWIGFSGRPGLHCSSGGLLTILTTPICWKVKQRRRNRERGRGRRRVRKSFLLPNTACRKDKCHTNPNSMNRYETNRPTSSMCFFEQNGTRPRVPVLQGVKKRRRKPNCRRNSRISILCCPILPRPRIGYRVVFGFWRNFLRHSGCWFVRGEIGRRATVENSKLKLTPGRLPLECADSDYPIAASYKVRFPCMPSQFRCIASATLTLSACVQLYFNGACFTFWY